MVGRVLVGWLVVGAVVVLLVRVERLGMSPVGVMVVVVGLVGLRWLLVFLVVLGAGAGMLELSVMGVMVVVGVVVLRVRVGLLV